MLYSIVYIVTKIIHYWILKEHLTMIVHMNKN
jgi:hypothetical protein